jgi:hypothetical protein
MIFLRPLSKWHQRAVVSERSPFRASYDSTKKLLQREANALSDHGLEVDVVVELDLTEQQLASPAARLARQMPPPTPRVAVSFHSRYGPLRLECSRWNHWRDNLRAIGLSLQALRQVDRAGVSCGQQYNGWYDGASMYQLTQQHKELT